MIQKRLAWLTAGMLVGVTPLALAQSNDVTTDPADDAPDAITQQMTQNDLLAHKMMGHINLAQMALNLDLPSEAGRQIDRARSLDVELATQMPELKLDSSFEYGKVTYEGNSTLTDHYIPVIDDTFLVSDYKDIYKRANVVDVDELSAGVMHLRVAVDLREVSTALDEAETAIAAEDYDAAETALNGVFKNAIVDEDEVEDPQLLISENLALAKAFVEQEQYDSARLTLKHVQDRLKTSREGGKKDDLAGIDEKTLSEFSTELDQIQADLRKKDPTLRQRVADGLDRWGDRVSGWFS